MVGKMSMKKVFVFGTGKLYKKKEAYINHHFNVLGFIDNRVTDEGLVYGDTKIPMYSPKNIEKYLQPDVWIILMSYQYVPMWEQLYKLGIDGKNILFGIMFPPYTESLEELFSVGHLGVEDSCVFFYSKLGEKVNIENHKQLEEMAKMCLRDKYRRENPFINAIAQMGTNPVSRKFGMERGSAVDRYYIESFLEKNKKMIYGDCLEIAENTYTLKYGEDRIKSTSILHLEGWGDNAVKGNLETGEGIVEDRYDCAIITQTLMFIYNVKAAVENIYKMLKRGGGALITVSGISQVSRYDAELWGSYYGFHEGAMKALFEPVFGEKNVEVYTYGNVKTIIAMLYGLCVEDLCEEDFREVDKDYPLILAAVIKKE